jgi:hypothetical protein
MQLAEILHFPYTVFDSLNALRHLVASEPSALASHPLVALMTKRRNVRFGPVFDRETGIQTHMQHTMGITLNYACAVQNLGSELAYAWRYSKAILPYQGRLLPAPFARRQLPRSGTVPDFLVRSYPGSGAQTNTLNLTGDICG